VTTTDGVEVHVDVRPAWAFRLQTFGGRDGTARRRGGVLERLVHVDDEAVVVRVGQPERDRVVLVARARSEAAAGEGVARMRFALGIDDDLRSFHERYRWDPRIGRALRRAPWLRVLRRPDPFEALAWAICEQLIDSPRAAAIQRRLVFALGRRCPETGLRDVPSADVLAAAAPARLEACGLSAGRSLAMIRASREVARGRVDLRAADHERGWRRLRAIPGIGPWTVEMLALHGQGRYDQVPAGDLNLLKLVGRWRTGNPHARAAEDEVREVFAPYGEYAGLAATYGMRFGLAA
jgi:3-methyladenine DNA glycosylase/8-oxoguanine DNA glycosylase